MRLITLRGLGRIHGLHYTPDGRRLLAVGGASVTLHDEARWVDVAEGRETLRVPVNAPRYALSPDLSRAAVGSAYGFPLNVHVPPLMTFDPAQATWCATGSGVSATGMTVLEREDGTHISGLAFDSTGDRLAVAAFYQHNERGQYTALQYLQLVELAAPREMPLVSLSRRMGAVAFSPDGTALVGIDWSDSNTTVSAWDASSLDHRHTLTPPGSHPRQPVFSPDGDVLAVPNSQAVHLLPPDLSAPRQTLAHPKQVHAVAFTPCGRRLLTTSTDQLVRIWDAAAGQLVTRYDFGIGGTTAVAVAPDGLTAAVAGQRGKVVLFDLDG